MKRLPVLMISTFVAILGLLPFDVWSMGSRVPTVGTPAEDRID
jgi:hypothetical protein